MLGYTNSVQNSKACLVFTAKLTGSIFQIRIRLKYNGISKIHVITHWVDSVAKSKQEVGPILLACSPTRYLSECKQAYSTQKNKPGIFKWMHQSFME